MENSEFRDEFVHEKFKEKRSRTRTSCNRKHRCVMNKITALLPEVSIHNFTENISGNRHDSSDFIRLCQAINYIRALENLLIKSDPSKYEVNKKLLQFISQRKELISYEDLNEIVVLKGTSKFILEDNLRPNEGEFNLKYYCIFIIIDINVFSSIT